MKITTVIILLCWSLLYSAEQEKHNFLTPYNTLYENSWFSLRAEAEASLTTHKTWFKERSSEESDHEGLLISDGETDRAANIFASALGRAEFFKFAALTAGFSLFKTYGYSLSYFDEEYTALEPAKNWHTLSVMAEQAYIDLSPLSWLRAGIGRLPTYDGSAHQQRAGQQQTSLFNDSFFNAYGDGAFLTVDLSVITGAPDSYISAVWLRDIYNDPRPYIWTSAEDVFKDRLFLAIVLNTPLKGLKNSSFQIAASFLAPSEQTTDTAIDVNGDGKQENMLLHAYNNAFWTMFASLNIPKFGTLPLDVYTSFHYTTYTAADTYSTAYMPGAPGQLPAFTIAANNYPESRNGYMGFASALWHLPFMVFDQEMQLGSDFSFSNKDFFMFSHTGTQPFNRFNFRGLGAGAWFMINIGKYASARLSYMYQKHNYPWMWFSQFNAHTTGSTHINEQFHAVAVSLQALY